MLKLGLTCLFIPLFTMLTVSVKFSPSLADNSGQTFDQIFGEFSNDAIIDSVVREEESQPGQTPLSPLESDILLSKATLARVDKAIGNLEKIVKSGGWPVLPAEGYRLKNGERSAQVEIVKQQLLKQGDLEQSRINMINHFDDSLEDAVTRFQKRHGLRTSGFVDRKTRLAMAVSAQLRLGQLRINRHRLEKALSVAKGQKYVMVNIPDYSLQAVSDDRIELASRVVVGRQDRQTPEISAYIDGVNLNPFWHVPSSLVKEDLIPNQIKDPKFMRDNQIKIYRDWGSGELKPETLNWRSPEVRNYKFRQDPGDHNALGLIRVNMYNKENVYLHDTPTKKLYGLRARAYSAGCVRVEKIRDLSAWILKDRKEWDRSKLDETISAGKRLNLSIPSRIPVHFIYITAWVDAKGGINFRDDIYDRDQGLKKYASRDENEKRTRTLSP